MQNKSVIPDPHRIRSIQGGFGFIPHRFLQEGFFQSLNQQELLLYFFWILVADRCGISYYSDDSICKVTGLDFNELGEAREGLCEKELLCFQPPFTQVLELPSASVEPPQSPLSPQERIKRALQ